MASASPPAAAPEPPALTSEALRDAISAADIRPRLEQLERIAAANGGNRAAGTAGYDASVDHVTAGLEAVGYRVERQPFTFAHGAAGQVASVNLVAERPGVEGARVLMLGAHLDSVPERAGINDNASGSMMLLALAEGLAQLAQPEHTVRFAFWGAEEPGLYGSSAYVDSLTVVERERLIAYLNFDMVGSPNYIRFIYDDRAAAPGSSEITRLFADHFESAGLAWDTFDLSGKTDHAPFAAARIPTGGLFSGGGELKTDAQAAAFGGTAGVPADACDDAACDTTANVNDAALEELSDAAADALVRLSQD
ncbi:MAG TPA: M20/M25/M40 family metallo-hydrolase [Candidatus Limnocylindria bacterium]|nr:M20/M25/M40 family metallo-hydrolase [Candidatus Limnocylindria bacterium]